MPSPPTAVRLSIRVYRKLLRAYPPTFRKEFGGAMEDTFTDAATAAHERAGLPDLGRLWLRIMKDLALSVTRERLDARRQKASSAGTTRYEPPTSHRSRLMRTPDRRPLRLRLSLSLTDARQAARALLRAPAFTLIAVLTLATGIASVVTIFGVIQGVLLRPLP